MRPSATADQYQVMQGAQPAFVFDDQILNAYTSPAPQVGSPLGVPPPASIAGQTPGVAQTAEGYASAVTQRGAGSHPILWLIILMVVGIAGLGFVAHMEVKKRGA